MFLYRLMAPSLVLFLGVSLAPELCAQRGATTVQRNLAELADRADVILRGQVLSATFEPHPELHNLETVVVTVRVNETIKGSSPAIYSFRQFIWDIRDRFNTAGYRKGQDLLLMMNKPSRLGLTSPVGLEQGRFRIMRDASGAAFAVNGRGNAGLFRNLEAQLRERKVPLSPAVAKVTGTNYGAVRVEYLSEVIRGLVGKR